MTLNSQPACSLGSSISILPFKQQLLFLQLLKSLWHHGSHVPSTEPDGVGRAQQSLPEAQLGSETPKPRYPGSLDLGRPWVLLGKAVADREWGGGRSRPEALTCTGRCCLHLEEI